jgi:hypothetical protein
LAELVRRRFAKPRSRSTSCAGSNPAPSARGWLTELARCPAGNRRRRRESPAGSSPAPSALDDEAAWSSRPFEAGWARQRAGGRVLRHPRGEGEAARAAAGLNPAGRSRAGDQGLRLPLARSSSGQSGCLISSRQEVQVLPSQHSADATVPIQQFRFNSFDSTASIQQCRSRPTGRAPGFYPGLRQGSSPPAGTASAASSTEEQSPSKRSCPGSSPGRRASTLRWRNGQLT